MSARLSFVGLAVRDFEYHDPDGHVVVTEAR